MFRATYGPIRSDPGTIAFHRDYLEFEGLGVRYQGVQALRVIIPCIIFLAGPIGAVVAYFLVEYALTGPTRLIVPLMQIRRVLLDPLRGTVMIGSEKRPGGPMAWHSFATAYAWAIFDGLEPLLPPSACGLLTRRERALARGDLAVFLAMCSLVPGVGLLFGLVGAGAGLMAATMGERRYGLVIMVLCLAILVAQVFIIQWWFSH